MITNDKFHKLEDFYLHDIRFLKKPKVIFT